MPVAVCIFPFNKSKGREASEAGKKKVGNTFEKAKQHFFLKDELAEQILGEPQIV